MGLSGCGGVRAVTLADAMSGSLADVDVLGRRLMENFILGGVSVPYIASRQNPRVSAAVRLSDRRRRESTRTFLCEGVKLTLEAVRAGLVTEAYICESDAARLISVARDVMSVGGEVFVLARPAFERISTESAPQGVISLCRMREFITPEAAIERDGPMLLLDSVRDPGNLGTVIRSASALGGVMTVLLSCTDVYNSKTVRASMGAVFKSDIACVSDGIGFVRELTERGRRVIAASPAGESMVLGRDPICRSDCIIIGNEGHGISDELLSVCTSTLVIPICADTESLNASAAAAVILWEWVRGD